MDNPVSEPNRQGTERLLRRFPELREQMDELCRVATELGWDVDVDYSSDSNNDEGFSLWAAVSRGRTACWIAFFPDEGYAGIYPWITEFTEVDEPEFAADFYESGGRNAVVGTVFVDLPAGGEWPPAAWRRFAATHLS